MTTPDDTRTEHMIVDELESFKLQEGWRDRSYDFGRSVVAALRDSGWVDPEEAARLRNDLDFARTDAEAMQEIYENYRTKAEAQRDALLPVVEAARQWRHSGEVTIGRSAGEALAAMEPAAESLRAAVDLWESREESRNG